MDILLSIPPNIGKILLKRGGIFTCPLVGMDAFIAYCNKRGLRVTRSRLNNLDRLKIFSPIFRVFAPAEDIDPLELPLSENNVWFESNLAWDTTNPANQHVIPNPYGENMEAYYSVFQIDHLMIVLSCMTISIEMDSYIDNNGYFDLDWVEIGHNMLESSVPLVNFLRNDEFRRTLAILCQFISDRYYPRTQGDQRRIRVPSGYSYSDQWICIKDLDWNWHDYIKYWDATLVEKLFKLTPERLQHAYETLARAQAYCDPLENWHQLTQFVAIYQRERLKGDALRAEILRSGAQMLRSLYKDLYNIDLPDVNEVHGTIIKHVPELDVRVDIRKYLELVVNRFHLNPQPSLCLIVEGFSEEIAIIVLLKECFGIDLGIIGIEMVVLGGIDKATGGKKNQYQAIFRLLDYLHHHQIFTFLIIDNENNAFNLKKAASKSKSIHDRRHVTRYEYIKIWGTCFEFDNFSNKEIADSMTTLSNNNVIFTSREISQVRQAFIRKLKKQQISDVEVHTLEMLYNNRTGNDLKKPAMAENLVRSMLLPSARRKIENRPIIKTLVRVRSLALRNHLPATEEIAARTRVSKLFGKLWR